MPTEEAGPSEQLPPGTFRDAARRNIGTTDLWTPLVLSLPKQDRRNPIPAIIQQQAGLLRIKLDPIRVTALARDYNRAWRESGLPAGDRRFDHQAQVTWFLQYQPQNERLKPGLNRKQKLALAGTAALAIATPIFAISRPNEVYLSSPPANPQVTPAGEPKPEPEAKSIEIKDLFKEFLKPFIEEALKKRAERAKTDPEYYHRVDKELNENRVNIVLFGYGEEHGEPYENYGGSISIMSLDLKTNKIGVVHLSRDIRVPEIEQRMPPNKQTPMAMRHVYMMGGTELMQLTAEDATGLAIDFQVVAKDLVLRDALNRLADGSLEIEVPKEHDTGPFRLDRIAYEGGVIPAGKQRMDTMQLMRYVLSEDKRPQGKEDERSYRKSDVMRALSKVAKDKLREDPRFLLTFVNFINEEVKKGRV